MNSFGVISNLKYSISELKKNNKKQMYFWILEIIMASLDTFLFMLIPSIIIFLLTNKIDFKNFVIYLSIIFAILATFRLLFYYLKGRNEMYHIEVRMFAGWTKLLKKLMSCDFINVESESKQKELNKAVNALNSNWVGLEFFNRQWIDLLKNALSLILFTIVIGQISPLIIIFLLGISVINSLCFKAAYKYEFKNKDSRAKLNKSITYVEDQAFNVASGKDIRLYQMQDWLQSKESTKIKDIQKILYKERIRFFGADLVSLVLKFLRDGVSYGYLLYLLSKGMNVGLFVLYLNMISGFSTYFSKITDNINEIKRASLRIDDLRNYLSMADSYKYEDGEDLKNPENISIKMEHVDFKYPDSQRYILKDFNLEIKAGEKIALVGVNGAGKTTIVKLLSGLYQPTAGKILINNQNIAELNLYQVYKAISVVFQESFIYSFEIFSNVSIADKSQTDMEKVKRCCEDAGIAEKIESLKDGYNTFIGKDFDDNGIQLSGGQKQKLMLARALYKGGSFIILDEPTAQLDALSESEMYENFLNYTKNKTSLFISHRLASTRFCNRIIFLENGKIIEEGTHDDLMAVDGKYAEMFDVQAKYYVEEEGEFCAQ